jgi:hypothetical protein
MSPIDLVFFGITMFFASAALVKWRRRRVINARRVNRGLRGYVTGKSLPPATDEKTEELNAA